MAEIKLGKYKHFKGGEYEVLGVAKDSDTLKEFVVYKALYGEGQIWIRGIENFLEMVERDGKRCARFEYLGH